MNTYSHVNCKVVGSDWISGECPACAWEEGYRAGILKLLDVFSAVHTEKSWEYVPEHNKTVLAKLGRAMAEGYLGYPEAEAKR